MPAELFQVVSAGKTLRGKSPGEVLQAAAKAFSIPEAKARTLLLKGWVIKDRLSSKQVLEYRSRLQRMGLRVEVFPAGKYDNRALLARLEQARRRRRGMQSSNPAQQVTSDAVRPTREHATTEDKARREQGAPASRAQRQLESLFDGGDATIPDPISSRSALAASLPGAALVPALFSLLLGICLYSVASAIWQFARAALAGELGAGSVMGLCLSISLSGLVAALVAWPFFGARRLARDSLPKSRPLKRRDAQGLYLLLDVLAGKSGLPGTPAVSVTAGSAVRVEAGRISEAYRQSLALELGLGAAYCLTGNELLALVARQRGMYRGRLRATVAWLALETPRRLQWVQWAMENDRSVIAPGGHARGLLRPLHNLLALCGRGVIPILDRLEAMHQIVARPAARMLEREGDRCAAHLIGSDGIAPFAERWHRMVHADLMVAEVNREAAIAGQRLENYPRAIQWTMRNLDRETLSNLELAMSQPSDCWDPTAPVDNDRVAAVEQLGLAAAIQAEFSVQRLIDDLPGLASEVSADIAAADTRPVDNQQLLCTSEDAEQALRIIGEFFNRVPPRRFLPLETPGEETLAAMGLQECVDWLRTRLVDLRDLTGRLDELAVRAPAVELGVELLRHSVKIRPADFHLGNTEVGAAESTQRELRQQRDGLQAQYQQIQEVFVLRMKRAIGSMKSEDRAWADSARRETQAFTTLAPHLDRLDELARVLGLAIDRLSLEPGQRETLQKFYGLAQRGLQVIQHQVNNSDTLSAIGVSAALEQRLAGADRAAGEDLPRERQALIDTLQEMELRCRTVSATVNEHYHRHISRLLGQCLEIEKALQVRPLRLVGELA
ncbi:hypothetical protein [Microbulbifer sediminum]|uniref:hypothetical protein n=1 Tax=Microbulbifer sediminum TaxID=2904250 RepID=UPI001F34842C|nr:hypothetical protein [Microbulbifer sediminum]